MTGIGATTASALFAPEDTIEFFDHAVEQGWSDGLPMIVPTEERVEAMIGNWGSPDEVLGTIPPRRGDATARAVAANAVMAGCRPAYFPVVAAAIEAACDPGYWLYGAQPTTSPGATGVLVSGPIAQALGVNGGFMAFGPGFRANATIGRAVRLCLRNIGGALPGTTDLTTQGNPAFFTFCFAENRAESPWSSYVVDRGLAAEGASTVTVFSALSFVDILDQASKTAPALLRSFTNALERISTSNALIAGGPLIALCPEHARLLADAGFTRRDVERFLYEHVRIPVSWFSDDNVTEYLKKRRPRWAYAEGPLASVPLGSGPEDYWIAVVGGGGPHSHVMNSLSESRPITRPVRVTGG